MDAYEQALVKLCEYCGFSYEPGPQPESDEWYALEVVGIPYQEFEKKIVPGYWIRSIALHLHDTLRACNDVVDYLRFIPAFLKKGMGAMDQEWQEESLNVIVADELRGHVFWFLTFSETLRDMTRWNLENEIPHLVPDTPSRKYRSSIPVKALSDWLAEQKGVPMQLVPWVAQQLSYLDIHCKQTRYLIEEFTSEPDAPAGVLVQRFANMQAVILDIARVLVEADYAVDLWNWTLVVNSPRGNA